jgi:sialate O-acetylesterase
MNNLKFLISFIFILFSCTSLFAKIRLPQLIGDKMVLQRDINLNIWGWADVGEKVTVRFQGKYYYTEADHKGKWSAILPPQKAGGPYIMEINEIIIRDILIGDVWLCLGQSNQETPIARLVERFPEINVSNNHMIRHFKVPSQNSIGNLSDNIESGGKWYSGVASEVLNWTSLAYFFAKEGYAYNNIPMGMLVSSQGGTNIESWISQEHLKAFPKLVIDQEAFDSLKIIGKDKGVDKWTLDDFDDSYWKTTKIPSLWRSQGLHTKAVVYYRKNFDIPASMEGRHARLFMGVMVESDSVFVNGQFIGSTSYTYPPRKYDIPAGILKAGKNVITVRLMANGGNGGFVNDKTYKIIGDDVEVDLTGEWKYKVGLDMEEMKVYQQRLQNLKTSGSGLYNGMIYPIRDYKIKGAIWYQGESNAGNPKPYQSYLEALIANYRELWGNPSLPFLLVQLPNFMEKSKQPLESGWAGIREAQFKTALAVPNTALAVTYDLGEWNDIHPLNKKDVSKRLFLAARKLVYGDKIVSSGPLYKNMKVEGDKIVLTFTELGSGLISKNGPLRHFAIAGEDKKFIWANAIIKGNKVIVSAKDIKNPVAVRYAWSNNPEDANLVNKEGLLASPFRTDNW